MLTNTIPPVDYCPYVSTMLHFPTTSHSSPGAHHIMKSGANAQQPRMSDSSEEGPARLQDTPLTPSPAGRVSAGSRAFA